MDLRVTGYVKGSFYPFTPKIANYLKECMKHCDTLLVEVTDQRVIGTIEKIPTIKVIPDQSDTLFEAYEEHSFEVVCTGETYISTEYSTFACLYPTVRMVYVKYPHDDNDNCFMSECLTHMFKADDELGSFRLRVK